MPSRRPPKHPASPAPTPAPDHEWSDPAAPPPVEGRSDATPRPDTRTDAVFKGKRLFPFQAKAEAAIAAGKNVLVAAPTWCGSHSCCPRS